MSYDGTKPETGGALVAADIRENFRALLEDQIVNAGSLNGINSTQFVRSDVETLMNADLNMQGHIIRFNNGSYEARLVLQNDNNVVFYTPFHTLAFGTTSGSPVIIDGGTVWHSGNDGLGSGLDADLVRGLPADFTSSLIDNGYQKLPSGLIIQWGTGTSPSDGGFTITFPIAFPNVCLSFNGICISGTPELYVLTLNGSGPTTTQAPVAVYNDWTAAVSGVGYYWIAIGY